MTNTHAQNTGDHSFLIGLIVGGIAGTALALAFAPRATQELRGRVSDSARRVGRVAAERLDQVSTRVGDAMDHVATAARALQDQVGDALAPDASETRRRVTNADKVNT